nr:immunoglobulin heavy chain junction region [Macaca mulatta]MOV36483.1 immunoglobulin heavy chain junction region [Macaca mulatta]MOV36696.1 immunoglobulin heavy chain junction region [Macaca mulatta]MOV36791.1 immunoglobulin heavy chain junction region [Macaca mulatta]
CAQDYYGSGYDYW